MLNFGMLFESQAGKVIGEGVRNAERQTMEKLMARRSFCLDYYHGEINADDGGKDEYLLSFFQVWDKDQMKMVTPEKLMLEHVDLTKQIIDNKARNYIEQPARKVKSKTGDISDATNYTQLLQDSGWYSTAKQVEAYTQLLSDLAVGVFVNKEEKKLQYLIVPEYYPVFYADDPLQLNPIGIAYPTARRGKNGEQLYAYWDSDVTKFVTLDGRTEKDTEETNEYGVFNFFFPHQTKPVFSHFSRPRTTLAEANRAVDVAVTGLNQSLLYNSFKFLAIVGKVEGGVTDLLINKSRVLNVEAAPESNVSVSAIDLQADLNQQIDIIVQKIGLTANLANVKFDYKLEVTGAPASGRAIEVSNFKDLEDRTKNQEVLTDLVEKPLYKLVSVIAPKFGLGKVEQGELVVEWPEPKSVPSETERIAAEKHALETFQISYVDLLKEKNPDIDEEEAVKMLDDNAKIFRLVNGGNATEQSIMDILNDIDREDTGQPTGTPPTPRENQGGLQAASE